MDENFLVSLLKAEVVPAVGCTEPGAVALAVAHAAKYVDETPCITQIEISVSGNVYKNAVAVGIPGTGATGLPIAAALGAVIRNPELQLALLSQVSRQQLAAAQQLVADGRITVAVNQQVQGLWIAATVITHTDYCQAIIRDWHTNLVSIEKNGQYLLQIEQQEVRPPNPRELLRRQESKLSDMIATAEMIPVEELEFVRQGIIMNCAAAKLGIDRNMGLGIGAGYAQLAAGGMLASDWSTYAKMLTAAAADARMSGEDIVIMSTAGSGNHGITASLPVYAVADKMGATNEQMIRAVVISQLVTVYVKLHTGNLSALCGCAVAAATGATAGIAWLLSADLRIMEAAMKNVIANLTGMICDGGKVGCSLKLSTAAAAAVESALLAQRNIVVPDSNGIIAATIEETIMNLGKISNPGMLVTDKVILDVIMAKQSCGCTGGTI